MMLLTRIFQIRGDKCWRDLTCMNYHYETQPVPNPLSWFLHHAPPDVCTYSSDKIFRVNLGLNLVSMLPPCGSGSTSSFFSAYSYNL